MAHPTFPAIYENGVIRPIAPLPFANGTQVRVTVVADSIVTPAIPVQRSAAIAALESLIAASDDEPSDDYDLLRALDANRSPGERKLYPPEMQGITW